MKKYFCLIAAVIMLITAAFAQNCSDAKVLAYKTNWIFEKNSYLKGQAGLTPTLVSNILKKTEDYKKLFMAAYPQAIGGTIRGTAYIPQASEYDIKGWQRFQYHVSYFGYHCNNDNTKVITELYYLSNSDAFIQANDLKGVLKHFGGDFELNGKPVQLFKLAHRREDLRGVLSFQAFGTESLTATALLFTHNGKLPYRQLSREEYLTIIKKVWEKKLQKSLDEIDNRETLILKMIADTKRDYTGETREKALKELNGQLEQFRKSKVADKKKASKNINEELDAINGYLNTASKEDLAKSAIPVSESVYRGFTTEKEGGHYLVVLDETYFNKNLPAHAAQTLVLLWYYIKSDPGAVLWSKTIKENFPLDKLKALVDK